MGKHSGAIDPVRNRQLVDLSACLVGNDELSYLLGVEPVLDLRWRKISEGREFVLSGRSSFWRLQPFDQRRQG
jgi:hypothetical protein